MSKNNTSTEQRKTPSLRQILQREGGYTFLSCLQEVYPDVFPKETALVFSGGRGHVYRTGPDKVVKVTLRLPRQRWNDYTNDKEPNHTPLADMANALFGGEIGEFIAPTLKAQIHLPPYAPLHHLVRSFNFMNDLGNIKKRLFEDRDIVETNSSLDFLEEGFYALFGKAAAAIHRHRSQSILLKLWQSPFQFIHGYNADGTLALYKNDPLSKIRTYDIPSFLNQFEEEYKSLTEVRHRQSMVDQVFVKCPEAERRVIFTCFEELCQNPDQTAPVIIHGDLPDNLHVRNPDRSACIVDFDTAKRGYPIDDFIMMTTREKPYIEAVKAYADASGVTLDLRRGVTKAILTRLCIGYIKQQNHQLQRNFSDRTSILIHCGRTGVKSIDHEVLRPYGPWDYLL